MASEKDGNSYGELLIGYLLGVLVGVFVIVFIVAFWKPISTRGCLLIGYISLKDEKCCQYIMKRTCTEELNLIFEAVCFRYTESSYFKQNCFKYSK